MEKKFQTFGKTALLFSMETFPRLLTYNLPIFAFLDEIISFSPLSKVGWEQGMDQENLQGML